MILIFLAGNKNVNICDEEGEKNPPLPYTFGVSHPSSSNGNRHLGNPNVKQKGMQKHYTSVPKAGSKLSEHKKNMDLKNDKEKGLDLSQYEIEPSDEKDSALLQNGLVNCGLITNGYSIKDNDGSGSEGGYTTPKKRKSRCSNAKSADNTIKEKERDVQPRSTTQEVEALNVEGPEKGTASRLDGFRSSFKVEAQTTAKRAVMSETLVVESQRKNSDGKAAGTFGKKAEEKHKGKLSSPSKEDSWTLFKPPPVFPVDNSSAKIVPKISYASKVKENLNKVAQGGENVASSLESNSSSTTTLGDIFQNQWGLSFINEPNLGLEGGSGFVPAEDQTSVTSQSQIVKLNRFKTMQRCFYMYFFYACCCLDAIDDFCPGMAVSDRFSLSLSALTDPKRVVFYDETKDGPDK
uniref:Nuclear FMR1 interacting protein 2 n=1 Tax=Cyprinodon variegatus TaxID=28743 RepID=A0A3Q2EA31_CYPVA